MVLYVTVERCVNNQIENNGPSGTRDAFLVKYDLFGNVEFIKTFGGTGGEVFTQIVPTHLDTYMGNWVLRL